MGCYCTDLWTDIRRYEYVTFESKEHNTRQRRVEKSGIKTYSFDNALVAEKTHQMPQWVHFGGGNIFRAFIAALQQQLLNQGAAQTGIITAETYDEEVIEKCTVRLIT